MQELLPDFGDLVLYISLMFSALIIVFETLERRRERRNHHLEIENIGREYTDLHRLGYF